MKRIITHPGTAHGDDLIACCILAAKYGAPIYRREPTTEDYESCDTIVVDVGGQYNPDYFLFDHHQDEKLECSLVLVAKWLGLHEKFKRAYRWYENVDFRDRNGEKKLGEKYNLSQEQLLELSSPVHTPMLAIFGRMESIKPLKFESDTGVLLDGDELHDVMQLIGKELIEYAEKYDAAWTRLENCEHKNLRGHEVLINPSDDITATGDYARENHISVMVSHDNYGAGWSILRTNEGEKAFDFNRVVNDPRIAFAHKGGFIAKTRERVAVSEVVDLIEKALV